MQRYVAFLRGINVGGRIIKMADLKACFEKAGFSNVTTLLQTGNVAFENSDQDTTKLKQQIEKALTKTFSYPAKVQVYKLSDLEAVIDQYPFGKATDSQHDYVIFMENGLEKEIIKEPYELATGEKIAAGKGVIYWRVDKGTTLQASFAKWLAKAKYKDFNTNRNLKTLRKLLP